MRVSIWPGRLGQVHAVADLTDLDRPQPPWKARADDPAPIALLGPRADLAYLLAAASRARG